MGFFDKLGNWLAGGPVQTEPVPAPAPAAPVASVTGPNLADPVDIIARTIWGEARGDGYSGMTAVANVIATRAANPRWWGSGFVSVCTKPEQFDCWNKDETPGSDYQQMIAVTTADGDFVMARNIATEAVAGTLHDLTGGADSYYAPASVKAPPAWATPDKFKVQVGKQLFYRVELPPLVA